VKQLHIKEARLRRGLTQKQLEAATGVEQAVISKIERGATQNPRFDIVIKLAAGLRIDPRALRFGAPHAEGVS
jgi:transcriptional regulator with XRE-family HTH domain